MLRRKDRREAAVNAAVDADLGEHFRILRVQTVVGSDQRSHLFEYFSNLQAGQVIHRGILLRCKERIMLRVIVRLTGFRHQQVARQFHFRNGLHGERDQTVLVCSEYIVRSVRILVLGSLPGKCKRHFAAVQDRLGFKFAFHRARHLKGSGRRIADLNALHVQVEYIFCLFHDRLMKIRIIAAGGREINMDLRCIAAYVDGAHSKVAVIECISTGRCRQRQAIGRRQCHIKAAFNTV